MAKSTSPTPSNDNIRRKPKIIERRQQTVKHKGKRIRLVTITRADGSVSVTTENPPVLEIDLQAEAVKHLKRLPGYVSNAAKARPGSFTLAADQNGSGFRGRNAAVKLKAAGMAAGEPDLRVNFYGGVIRYIEFKSEKGSLEESQERRFPLLRALGFEIAIVAATTPEDAAAQAVALVRGWLAGNDNNENATKSKHAS